MAKAQFGMIGLGTMGRNFLLNIAEKGISGIGYNRDNDKLELLIKDGEGFPVTGVSAIEDLVSGLESPRRIMLLVPAGAAVDSVINDLLPYLEPGDLLIDGGNSHFPDTERRQAMLLEKGIAFLGVGVSGGEEGARHGASIMVGGSASVYDHVRPIFEAASAKVNGEPCAALVGNGSAGHFVKMVHNGIEYGMMQLLAETYDFMHRVLNLDYRQMSDTFAEWNEGELNSFLVEITATVLRKIEPGSNKHLVEIILDTAGQKGTGKWTSQAAMDLGIAIPTIDSAVSMRQISALKKLRSEISTIYPPSTADGSPPETLHKLKNALYAAFIVTYAQGLALLQSASTEKEYGLNLAEVAKIWRGGCIIRSALLEKMRQAFSDSPDLPNLVLDHDFAKILTANLSDWQSVIGEYNSASIPSLCFSSTLNYFNSIRSERLPANVIQAQRDFFGAHTYQRLDRDGSFHTPDWEMAEN
ncbi:MAG: NADP-dependent phosphogluconate dehydrogenase [Pyrinomonadaceae bacterium]